MIGLLLFTLRLGLGLTRMRRRPPAGGGGGIPANVWVDENGDPWLDENGDPWTDGT